MTQSDQPNGIAQAILIAGEFYGARGVALMLGDNIFYGHGMTELLASAVRKPSGASVFAYHIHDAEP